MEEAWYADRAALRVAVREHPRWSGPRDGAPAPATMRPSRPRCRCARAGHHLSSHLLCLLRPELRRAPIAECLVGPTGVVPADPGGDGPPCLGEVGERALPHALIFQGAEEPFDQP